MSTDDKRIREFAYQIWESKENPKARRPVTGKWRANWRKPKPWPRKSRSRLLRKPRSAKRPMARLAMPRSPRQKTKAKPAAASKVIPPGEKAAEKSPGLRENRQRFE